MLYESARCQPIGQPWGVYADLPPLLHRDRRRDGQPARHRQQIHHESQGSQDRALHRQDDEVRREGVQDRGTRSWPRICLHGGELLQGGHTERARRHFHRRKEERVGRAARHGVQSWFLGRLLLGAEDGRMEQALRICGYGEEGLRGARREILLPPRRG